MATLADNRKAAFDYELLDKYEAGLALLGKEVKSIKTGHISLKGSFVTRKGMEFYLTNATIPRYQLSNQKDSYNPTRSRKLLLRKAEIKSLLGKMAVRGLTLVPLRVYTKKRLIKLEFALGKGKKRFDKRQDIAKREAQRKIERSLKD